MKLADIKDLKGHNGIYYYNLVDGNSFSFNEQDSFISASTIKLAMLLAIYKWVNEGKTSLDTVLRVKESDKVLTSGALHLINGEFKLDIDSLNKLMIELSDNTATNVLMDYFGMDKFNEEFLNLGLKQCELHRHMMDFEAVKNGLNNYASPLDMFKILKDLYEGKFLSKNISDEILNILKDCQGGYMESDVECIIAHKPGSNDRVINDVGIVYSEKPFIICYYSENINEVESKRFLRELVKELADGN